MPALKTVGKACSEGRQVQFTLRNSQSHPFQQKIRTSLAKRLIIKAGRRGAKTVGLATRGVEKFLGLKWELDIKGNPCPYIGAAPKRVLYCAPTGEQTDSYWFEVKRALMPGCEIGLYKMNETERYIEVPGTKQRIKAKTAWNPDTARGDYADELQFDEYQLQNEDVWSEVGQPMLMDNNGDAVFAFTPPSLKSDTRSKARDPRHASKMFKKAGVDTTGLWETLHFTSHDNPFISREGLALATQDMSLDSYRREIMAEDDEIEQSWLVYGKFNEAICKIRRFIIPPSWPVYSGHDFGSANPAALFIAQNPGPEEPRTTSGTQIRKGDFVIFREYSPGPGYSTFQHVQSFLDYTSRQGYRVRRSVGGNLTTEDEIRQGYGAHGWAIMAPRIGRVNAQLDRVIAGIERNKYFIFDDLVVLLSQMSNCMWELDLENKPVSKIKDEARYHLLAALRYIGSDFTPDTSIGMNKPFLKKSEWGWT